MTNAPPGPERLPPKMETLANNFADFPPRKSFWDMRGAPGGLAGGGAASLTPRTILGRLASTVALMLVLGGLIGFGAYRFAVSQEDTAPPPPSLETTPLDDTTGPAQDVAPSPADPNAPALVVTGLLGNQPESQNWAGYAATEGGYTSVSATWNVPDIGLASPAGIDAAWVGIGGVRSHDLIQAGTERTVLDNGATQQEAWVELLPRPSETVPLKLGPGDTIRVSIDQQGPETWLIAFTNVTSGQTYQVTKRYASSLSSAEWIEEAPSAGRRRTLPLDNFGTVRFTQALATRDTQAVNIAQSGAHAITMITPSGQPLAEPSRLSPDGESFSVRRTSVPSPRRR